MMAKTNSQYIAACLLALSQLVPAGAKAQDACPPNEFLLSERTDLLQNAIYKLAFVETSTEDQWKRANQGGNILVNGQGNLNWRQAKEEGRKEARSINYALTTDNSYHLIANKVSETGAGAYVECLRNRRSGLALWTVRDDGRFVQVGVQFRPATNDFRIRRPTLKNFKQVTKLKGDFIAQAPQSLTFERQSCGRGFIGINVGREHAEIVMPPVPPTVTVVKKDFTTGDIEATQAYKVRHAPPSRRDACVAAPAGWTFVPGSATAHFRFSSTPSNSTGITKLTDEQLCWHVTGYTGDRTIWAHAVAFANATIQQTVVTPPACGI